MEATLPQWVKQAWIWSAAQFGMARRSHGALPTARQTQQRPSSCGAPVAYLRTFWSLEPMQPMYVGRPSATMCSHWSSGYPAHCSALSLADTMDGALGILGDNL